MTLPKILPDHPFYDVVSKVEQIGEATFFEVALTLFNGTNDKFSLSIFHLSEVYILQKFRSGSGDTIMVNFNVSKAEYTHILSNYSDLLGELTITRVKKLGYEPESEKDDPARELIHKHIYRVILTSYADPFKNLTKDELLPEVESGGTDKAPYLDLVEMTVQLVDEVVYNLPKTKFNFAIRGSVEDVFWYVTEELGLETGYLVPADNTATDQFIHIPPMLSPKELFPYLQLDYGVYNSGIRFYVHDGAAYLYPADSPVGKSKNTIHFYQVPAGFYMGSNALSYFKDSDLFMLVNEPITNNMEAVTKLETIGNSLITYDSSEVHDNWLDHTEDGAEIHEDNVVALDADIGTGVRAETHVPMFETHEHNEHILHSKLNQLYVEAMSFEINGLIPFAIKPFHQCRFHYVHDKRGKVIRASPDTVVCRIHRVSTNDVLYSTRAHITLLAETSGQDLLIEEST